MSHIIIRPFRDSDTAKTQSLIGEMHKHEMTLQKCLVPWEEAKDAFLKWMLSNVEEKSGVIFIAEDESAIVGMVAVWTDRDNYPGLKVDERSFGWVSDLVVTSAARKKGVGTKLLQAAEKFFLQQGVKLMKLTAFANNNLADSFYLGYGMQPHVTTYKKYLTGAR